MARPPRSRTESLISLAVLRRILFLGLVESAAACAAFFWTVASSGIPFDAFTASTPAYREAITMTQAAIVVGQFFNGFTVRSDRQSVFSVGLLANWRLVVAECIGVGIIAAISYVPLLQSVFHTAALSAADWLLLVVSGVVLLAADEARKWAARRRHPSAGDPAVTRRGRASAGRR